MNFIKDKFFLILFVIGLCYLIPLYNDNFYVSHDSEPQVARSAAVYKALLDLQVPPRWAGDLNYTFGVPSPNFFFPMMGYQISVLHLIGLSLETSYKVVMGLSFILSGLFFYLWLSLRFRREVSFGASVIYMLAPYHFLNTFVRGQLGEMLTFVFVPLVLYSLEKFENNKSYKHLVLGILSYAALAVSHNILALLFSIIIGLYILVSSKNLRIIVEKSVILLLGLGLSAYFWLPALIEGKYINSKLFVGNYFTDHFISINNLIYAPWGFGPNINEIEGLAPQIGIIPFLLVLVSLFYIGNNKYRKAVLFWVTIIIVGVFFTNQSSSPVWSTIHILEQFQFPWRFMAIISFSAAVLSAYAFTFIKRSILIYLIIAVFLISSAFYIQVAGFTKKPDSFYLNYPGTGAYHGESTTIWTEGDASEYPAFPLEVIAGQGEISDYTRKSNIHKFRVVAKNDLVIKDNTTYYPGWRVLVSGEEVPIQFQDPNHRGLITFPVSPGTHVVEVRFTETLTRIIANAIFLFTLLFLIIVFLFRNRFDKLIKRL